MGERVRTAMKEHKTELRIREEAFQNAMKKWEETNDIKYWHEMFDRVFDCCFNICKKRLNGLGLSPDRIYDTSIKAASYVMDVIERNGRRPTKLSAFCWSYCTCYILKPQVKFNDKYISYMSQYSEETESMINSIPEEETEDYDLQNYEMVNGYYIREMGQNLIEVIVNNHSVMIETSKEEFIEKVYREHK